MSHLGKRIAALETVYSPSQKPWGLFSYTKAAIPATIAKAIADGAPADSDFRVFYWLDPKEII